MDRFLRYNSPTAGFASGQVNGSQVVIPSVQTPTSIENSNISAKVACDRTGLPLITATVSGVPVFQSDFANGGVGYTTIKAPNQSTSVKTSNDGMFIVAGEEQAGNVLTCLDNTGKCKWVEPAVQSEIKSSVGTSQVNCNDSGNGSVVATVQATPVFASEFNDGVNGTTTISAPSGNTSITLGADSMQLQVPGSTSYPFPGAVLTNIDQFGTAEFRIPSRIFQPANDLYTFVECGQYDVFISVNYDQPTGKLKIQTQEIGQPGQVLTLEDNQFNCKWMDLPRAAPLSSIFASTLDVVINTTPTVLYPSILPLSNVEYWSATVDTTFTMAAASSLTWGLYNSLGVQFGALVTTPGTSNSVHRLTYTYTFRKISTVEVRMTATATILSNSVSTVTCPVRYLAINTVDGMPFPRVSKTVAGSTVTAISRNAFYNVLNWIPPVEAAPFSITPDPFDGIVEAKGVDLVPEVATDAVADATPEFYVTEEVEMIPAAEPEQLASAPPPKRQRRA